MPVIDQHGIFLFGKDFLDPFQAPAALRLAAEQRITVLRRPFGLPRDAANLMLTQYIARTDDHGDNRSENMGTIIGTGDGVSIPTVITLSIALSSSLPVRMCERQARNGRWNLDPPHACSVSSATVSSEIRQSARTRVVGNVIWTSVPSSGVLSIRNSALLASVSALVSGSPSPVPICSTRPGRWICRKGSSAC